MMIYAFEFVVLYAYHHKGKNFDATDVFDASKLCGVVLTHFDSITAALNALTKEGYLHYSEIYGTWYPSDYIDSFYNLMKEVKEVTA